MQYYVYIMTNKSRTLYTGVTNNLERRVYGEENRDSDYFFLLYGVTVHRKGLSVNKKIVAVPIFHGLPVIIANDEGYVSVEEYQMLRNQIAKAIQLVNGYIRYLQTRKNR